MNKAIFLDRDGTINLDKNYLYKINDFEYCKGAVEGLRLLQKAGFLLIIITNQSGIGRGYYTEKDLDALNRWMIEDLKSKGITISKIYYCPHYYRSNIKKYRKKCSCRKPGLALFYKAIKEFDIDMESSYAIGDNLRDLSIVKVTKCKGFLLDKNSLKKRMDKINYAKNLYEASKKIICLY